MSIVVTACQFAALGCVAAAAVDDIRRFEISDRWSIAIVVLFVIAAVAALPPREWWPHAVAGVAVFAVGVGLFARGWLGGGDVKLLAACAVWSGFAGLPLLLGGTAFAGGLLALVAVAARRVAGPAAVYPALQIGGPLPYAVAILGGAVVFAVG